LVLRLIGFRAKPFRLAKPTKRSGVIYRSDDQGETWKAMTEYKLTGGSVQVNARIATLVLCGEPGPARDVVLLNAGAALFLAGLAPSVPDAVRRAAVAIDRGDARRTLERKAALSRDGARDEAAT
jgi:anthranilate phosphoribosyltransferase